jgi:site-specific recombinase XerC
MAYSNNDNFQSVAHSNLRDTSIEDQFNFTVKEGEVKWHPVKGACNGREMRRIICVVDRDDQKFRMLEIDDYNHDEEMST